MKAYFMPLLLWALALAPLAAQKQLPHSLHPYAANWTYTLVKAMHYAGFDMPTMPASIPVPTVGKRANPFQLDSTKTFYGYGLNQPGDSTPLFRTVYQYPQPNKKVENNYQYDNGAWIKVDRAVLTRDNQQRLVEVVAEAFDTTSQSFRPDSRLVIFPHGDSPELIDSFFTYLWDSTLLDWHIILADRNRFDAQDRLIESIHSLDYFGDPAIFQETYSYDANGDNHLIEEVAILGNDTLPSSRTDIHYVDHQPIEVLISASDGTSFLPQKRTNYAYTLFGAVRKQMNFEWLVAEQKWYLFQTIEYRYDNAQRLSTKVTAHLPLNAPETQELTAYAYVEDENLYSEWYFIWDDDLFDWIQDSKKYYYYDGLVSVQPDPIITKPLRMWPNPTVDAVRLQLNEPASVHVYNNTGDMVHSGIYQPDQWIPLTGLPSGLYAITARTEKGIYTNKVVKE